MFHGVRTYILQSESGQIIETHSVSAGLDYPGVGPEHAWLKDSGRAKYVVATDEQALRGFRMLTQLEGIIPALESSHAIWEGVRLASTMPADQDIVIVRERSSPRPSFLINSLVPLWTWRQRCGTDLAATSREVGRYPGLACIGALESMENTAETRMTRSPASFYGCNLYLILEYHHLNPIFIMSENVQPDIYQQTLEVLASKLRRRYGFVSPRMHTANLITRQTNRWLEESRP